MTSPAADFNVRAMAIAVLATSEDPEVMRLREQIRIAHKLAGPHPPPRQPINTALLAIRLAAASSVAANMPTALHDHLRGRKVDKEMQKLIEELSDAIRCAEPDTATSFALDAALDAARHAHPTLMEAIPNRLI
jgi:hypothetical protein